MGGVLIVIGLAGSFVLGRATRPSLPATAGTDTAAADPPEGSRAIQTKLAGGSRLGVPRLAPATDRPVAQDEPSERRATATFLVSSLFRRLERRPGSTGDIPETSANALRPYLQGMADTIKQTSPAVRAALAHEFTERLCGKALRDDELITMAYLGMEIPDITSSRAFDCVFSARAKQEDVVLWYMLDAWRQSGLEKTAAVAEIERSAADPRTQRRLLSRETEVSLRKAPLSQGAK